MQVTVKLYHVIYRWLAFSMLYKMQRTANAMQTDDFSAGLDSTPRLQSRLTRRAVWAASLKEPTRYGIVPLGKILHRPVVLTL